MCSIGVSLKEECSKEVPMKSYLDLEKQNERLLKIRSNCDGDITDVCRLHERKFLSFFAMKEKVCCDPMELHVNLSRRKSLREIDCRTMEKYSSVVKLIPGKKLCGACRKTLIKKSVK